MSFIRRTRRFLGRQIRKAISDLDAAEHAALVRSLGSVGESVQFHGRCIVTGAKEIELGDNVHIGRNAYIRGEGGLYIGDNTHISRNLVLYTVNHNAGGTRLPYDETLVSKPVHIGRNVWIGMNVCIAPGTRINDGAIIGLGTNVFGEVPAGAVVGSAQWRVIGNRDAEHYESLDSAKQFGGVGGMPLRRKK